jgi:tRNA dimethylallyltransferase
VGYRQVWEYLSGQTNKETMEERAIAATRQFAKRQYTWLRSECPEIWFDAVSPNIYNEVLKKLAMSTIL